MRLPTKEDFKKLYTHAGTFTHKAMFWEHGTPASRKKYPPVFTLKMEEHEGLPSAYQVYMDSVDEYDAASKLAPNMKVWDKLVDCAWFREGDPVHNHDGLKVWREHMKARDASLAKDVLIKQTKDGNTVAARALLAESKTKSGAGRKTKKNTKDPAVSSRVVQFNNRTGK